MSKTIIKQNILEYIKEFPCKTQGETLVIIHQANCFNTLHRARGIANGDANRIQDFVMDIFSNDDKLVLIYN